jgi:transposase
MKRGRKKLKLVLDEATATAVRERFRQTRDATEKERLRAVMLAATGTHTHLEIAAKIGRALSTVQDWLARMEEGSIEGLLTDKPRSGRPSALQKQSLQDAITEGLREGRWLTAPQLAHWLHKKHKVRCKPQRLYYWLGKLGGKQKVPRPVHTKKNAEEAKAFQEHLYDKLCELGLPVGRPVRVWVADEGRYGLHSFTRRCWGLRGVRVVKRAQKKYQWGYIFGALEVVSGKAEFCFLPTVNLDLSLGFLAQIAASDPAAEHVVIWDRAGFHQRPGDATLPPHVHILPLPAYSPELNPVEKVWDIVKDAVANRMFSALGWLENRLATALSPFWSDPDRTRQLVGYGWLHLQANAS